MRSSTLSSVNCNGGKLTAKGFHEEVEGLRLADIGAPVGGPMSMILVV